MEVPLSQSQKKSGGRDISDLKARLGLKKGGPAAPTKSGGVVAPPGLKSRQMDVPVPPGAKPPPPQLPSVTDDPFGAMNAMAAVGTMQRAPEIIVVNDGKPVEKVDNRSRAIILAKYAGMVLVPLILGISLGQISKTAKAVNKTIENAGGLHKDVNRIRTGIYDNLMSPLLDAKARGPGGNAFVPNDAKLIEALDKKDLLPAIDPEVAFSSYMFDMDKTLVADILAFYSQAAALKAEVDAHVQAAKNDAKLLSDSEKFVVQAKPDVATNDYLKKEFYRYGMFVEIPTKKDADAGARFGAKLVEIGPPICGDKKPSTTGKCPDMVIGFSYRQAGSGEGWDLMEIGVPQGESIPGKKIIPLLPTQVFENLIRGGEASTAEVGYMRRLNTIFEHTQQLIDLGNSVEKTLKAKANQSKSFTFFL